MPCEGSGTGGLPGDAWISLSLRLSWGPQVGGEETAFNLVLEVKGMFRLRCDGVLSSGH